MNKFPEYNANSITILYIGSPDELHMKTVTIYVFNVVCIRY